MTTAPGRFGERLKAWLFDLIGRDNVAVFLGSAGIPVTPELLQRLADAGTYIQTHNLSRDRHLSTVVSFLISGAPPDVTGIDEDAWERLQSDPSQFIGWALGEVASNAQTAEGLQTIGALIYDTSIGAITGQTAPVGSEAAERARQFVGYVTALGALPQSISTLAEVLSVGQIDQIGNNIQQVYWNLGLGFLTWQTMAPILQAAILEPLERDVQRQWRGKRFSQSQIGDLFALGEISEEELIEALREEGWRERDIQLVRRLSYRQLSQTDVFKLFQDGTITEEELAARLRRQGYSPEDVALKIALENRDDVEDDRRESITVLRNAFEDGLITESEFRGALSDQNYSDREIDLRVRLVRLKQESDVRRLSRAQLKDAWESNLVGDPEVRERLRQMDYAESEIELILDTWKAETAPGFLEINQSTILQMFRFAVYDERRTREELQKIGYDLEDANDLIALQKARYPADFALPVAPRQRYLSLGAVIDLYALGRLTDDDLRDWAIKTGLRGDDIGDIVVLIQARAVGPPRPLNQSTIEDAYVTGVFSRPVAFAALGEIGFGEENADVILDVVEEENPDLFSESGVGATRQPTIAALVKAVRAGLISETEYYERAADLGFDREGATIYLANAKTVASKASRTLTKTDILKAYREGEFSFNEAHTRLEEIGYSYEDADILIRLEKGGVQSTDVWQALLAGLLDADDAFRALLGLGFSEEEILTAIDELEAAGG